MKYCVVKDCKSSKQDDKNLKYFTFPKDPEIKKVWINACGKKNVNWKSGTICSRHFTNNDWRLKDILLNTPIRKRLLDAKAVPSLNIHVNSILPVERSKRYVKRANKQIVKEAIGEFDLK